MTFTGVNALVEENERWVAGSIESLGWPRVKPGGLPPSQRKNDIFGKVFKFQWWWWIIHFHVKGGAIFFSSFFLKSFFSSAFKSNTSKFYCLCETHVRMTQGKIISRQMFKINVHKLIWLATHVMCPHTPTAKNILNLAKLDFQLFWFAQHRM